ncbi:MAG: hypothetical protein U1F77_14805 [Kiritimatiellia bacterium]
MPVTATFHEATLGPDLVSEWRGDPLAAAAREVFPVAAAGSPAGRRVGFHLQPAPGGGGVLRMDGTPLCSVPADTHLAPLIEKIGSVLAVRLAPGWLVLHAGLMGIGDRFLLLPAERRSGKSTLCLALARHGWTYAGDDLVFFHPGRRVFHPFCKALTLKEGSFPLLPAEGKVHFDPARGPIRYFAPEHQCDSAIPAGRVVALATPLFDPASPPEGEIRPLAPELAALSLVQQLVGGAARGEGALEWIRELCALPCRILRHPGAPVSVQLARRCLEERT